MNTEERLEKLERKLAELAGAKRRGRAVILFGARNDTVQKAICAERFELVDFTGNTRAILGLDRSGQPGLDLCDPNGTTRARLEMDADGAPMLRLADPDGRTRVALGLNDFGQPELRLTDQNSKTRVSLVLNDFGEPMLVLADQNGKSRATLVPNESGQPSLALSAESLYPGAQILDRKSPDFSDLREKLGLPKTGDLTTLGIKASHDAVLVLPGKPTPEQAAVGNAILDQEAVGGRRATSPAIQLPVGRYAFFFQRKPQAEPRATGAGAV